MKIGMICRADNSGLGTLSWEFSRHLKPEKIVIVQSGRLPNYFERYKDFNHKIIPAHRGFTIEEMGWITDGIDVLLSIETFYSWNIVGIAKLKGVKTALVTMFEMSPENFESKPDIFICPSKLDFERMPEKKVYIPIPIATDRLGWRERKVAKTFIHTASHGGMNLRKGTPLLLKAMKDVKSDIKLIIYSWLSFESYDSRIEIRQVNFKNYWQLWHEGDVLIYPQDYNGICLPVSEAFASGLSLITTDIYPFNTWLPEDCLFKPSGFYKTRVASGCLEVDAANIDPKAIAEKIDMVANTDISHISNLGKKYSDENSWDKLLPKYLETLENLCKI